MKEGKPKSTIWTDIGLNLGGLASMSLPQGGPSYRSDKKIQELHPGNGIYVGSSLLGEV